VIQYPDNPDNTVKLGIYYVLLGGLEEYNREEYNRYCVKSQPTNSPLDTVFYCKYSKRISETLRGKRKSDIARPHKILGKELNSGEEDEANG